MCLFIDRSEFYLNYKDHRSVNLTNKRRAAIIFKFYFAFNQFYHTFALLLKNTPDEEDFSTIEQKKKKQTRFQIAYGHQKWSQNISRTPC